MFKTVKRIIGWCGEFKASLFIGFVFSFFSSWMVAAPVAYAGFTIGGIIDTTKKGEAIDKSLWLKSLGIITALVIGRFIFDLSRRIIERQLESIAYIETLFGRTEFGRNSLSL